jgi:hypothetical protein
MQNWKDKMIKKLRNGRCEEAKGINKISRKKAMIRGTHIEGIKKGSCLRRMSYGWKLE